MRDPRSIERMSEHQKKPAEKMPLTFKWVESDPFELKPSVRPKAEALPTSDTAFLSKPPPAVRPPVPPI